MRYVYMGAQFPAAECRACGMRFLTVQPDAKGLEAMYSAAYFEQDFRCGRADQHSFDENAWREENRGLLDEFERLMKPARLLEIGCASGWLLKHAAERGWQVKGVELSADAVAHARGLGLDVIHGAIETAGLPDASADLVYMGDVLEHVPDCLTTMAHVARVLVPGGLFYLRGPITTHSLARRVGLALYGFMGRPLVLREPPYHLWEFTPLALERLMRAVGLHVVTMRQLKIPPGRTHGEKSLAQRGAMTALDLLNAPLTKYANVLGDRVVLVARNPAGG